MKSYSIISYVTYAQKRFGTVLQTATGIMLMMTASPAIADSVVEGDVSPSDPTSWTSSTSAYIGNTASGTLSMFNGETAVSKWLHAGYGTSGIGSLNLSGSGTNVQSSWGSYIGYEGAGELNISDGAIFQSGFVVLSIGDKSGSTGTVSTVGSGSQLLSGSNILLGDNGGTGQLVVQNGATASASGYIQVDNSSSSLIVDGAGSSVSSSSDYIRNKGDISLLNGGTLSAAGWLYNDVGSNLKVEVTGNNMVNASNFNNYGTIQLIADENLASGTYTPLNASAGYVGTIDDVGGVWSAGQFTVTDAVSNTLGSTTSIDLANAQRMVIQDTMSIAFAYGSGASVDVTVVDSALARVNELEALLPGDRDVLKSYDFTMTGLSNGTDTLLSYVIGQGYSLDDLTIWHYDGTWSEYTPSMYYTSDADGTVNFMVNSFSSYAVTVTAIPELSSLALASILVVVGLLVSRRNK